jgi:hypothetical protein
MLCYAVDLAFKQCIARFNLGALRRLDGASICSSRECRRRYTVGRATAFFLVQGLLCAGQGIVDPFLPFKELPHWLKNFATLVIILPVTYMFADNWRDSGMFASLATLALRVQC